MNSAGRKAHWQGVYTTKQEDGVSWFQENPTPSLELLTLANATIDSGIIDIGGGASRLVDTLVNQGYRDLSVLDLSQAALEVARKRLAQQGGQVDWIVADITTWEPRRLYDIWHDRAALHFLTDAADQQAYADRLRRALRPGGYTIIGTFAKDGPEKCSGLPVVRHDAESLAAILGDGFALVDTRRHAHETPWQSVQQFQFSTFRFGA